MKKTIISAKVDLPDKISASYVRYILTLKGPKGELHRKVFHPLMHVKIENGAVVFGFDRATKREKTSLYCYVAHLKNMIIGVTEGYTYKMKICSGHFPMTVTYKNSVFEVKNFFGETVPRKVTIPGDVKITIAGNDITIESIDKEVAGQTAATIEQLTRRNGFDRRIFQDGIYIVEKAGKPVE
jgi:large subunit ribosomal protein L6